MEHAPERAPKLLDVEALAHHYGVARGSIARWASEDGWTPYGTRRRRQWDIHEAQRSYVKRHPAPGLSGGETGHNA